jgi:hypothetical protein
MKRPDLHDLGEGAAPGDLFTLGGPTSDPDDGSLLHAAHQLREQALEDAAWSAGQESWNRATGDGAPSEEPEEDQEDPTEQQLDILDQFEMWL